MHTAALVVLYAAPLLLLGGLLAAGRYPGERTIARLARARRPARRSRRATRGVALRARPVLRIVPRGGALLAAGLASRPPPA